MDEIEILKIVPHVLLSSQKKMWIDYDDVADVLYVSFRCPPYSVEHREDERGIVKNYDEKGKLTGLTIIAAKRFLNKTRQMQPVLS